MNALSDEFVLIGNNPFTMPFEINESRELKFRFLGKLKPDIYSYGMLIVVPPGSVKEHNFGLRSMPDQNRMEVTEVYKNQSGIYSLGFDLYNGEVNAVTENVVHDDQKLAFPSASRWLFIGYRAKLEIGNGTTDIEALIKDLVITPN